MTNPIYLILLLVMLSAPVFAAEPANLNATQAASGEHVLAERMARAWAWHWVSPNDPAPLKQLAGASIQFEKQLAVLSELSKTDTDLSETYSLLSQVWREFHAFSAASPSMEQARAMLDSSEELAYIATQGSEKIEARQGKGPLPVRLCSDIAALSQRLAKIYLLRSGGLKLQSLHDDTISARAEFNALTHQLETQPNNGSSINDMIQLMKTQWLFFEQAIDALDRHAEDAQLRNNVVVTSEHIYEVANELGQRYSRKRDIATAER